MKILAADDEISARNILERAIETAALKRKSAPFHLLLKL